MQTLMNVLLKTEAVNKTATTLLAHSIAVVKLDIN